MRNGWHGVRAALSEANYLNFTIGNVVSLIGTWVQRVALGWLIWELTGSGAWLGAVAFADLFPMVVVTPLAGALADRSDRLRVTRISQALLMVHAGLLTIFSALGLLSPWLILLLALIAGVVTAFNQPFRMALLPGLVARENLISAVAVNSIVFNIARFIGPAIAGLVIAKGSLTLAFVINFGTFAVFSWTLARIRLVSPDQSPSTSRSLLTSVVEGWRYAVAHTGLGVMLLMLTVVSLCVRPILELLPSYAAMFGSDATGFALMTSVLGLGSLVGATWLSRQADPRAMATMALSNGVLMGAALLVAALAHHKWLGLLALFILGFGMVVSGIANQTVIQLAVPDHLRGRLLALHSMIFRGGPALGALAIGVLSDLTGPRGPLAVGAALTLVFSGIVHVRRKVILRSLDL
ncbi:MFS transporter [Microvirga lotononidis]|uniref:Arabinose efflux permease family protein n=1 Tax=Microvirga lotononidis TaxID=864069 RepID=I4YN61_9HYPH|nr:MFS transporter [Microvirga lotononidis]EIM25403.1 arabinose efflux permease family protein [Microvirga lotononidis]WQO27301.1 MFS transporter [Microvirga lotononidis]